MGFYTDKEGDMRVGRVVKTGIGIAVLVVGLVGYLTNVYTVQTGEVAIVSTNGNITRVDGPGLHFKYPIFQSKVFMETREKSYIFGKTDEQDTTLEVSTKDMQSIKLEFTVQANIPDPEKLYRAFGMKYQDRFVRPRVKEIVQATIAKYTIEEFVTKRGLSVSNVSIVNHDFSDEYEKAIEAKKVAEQKVETAKAEVAKAQVEAENRVKLAEYALQEKELVAKANAIESNSLTPQLLKKMAIEKWDGKLPKVQSSANSLIKLED